MPGRLFIALLLLPLLLPLAPAAEAQGILERARQAAERAAERAVEREVESRADRAVTALFGATEDAIVCAVTDRECIERAREAGEELVIVDADGQPVAHENAPGEAATPGAAGPASPGAGAWANYDFVPGERILFVEDFSDTTVGRFPQRLEFQNGMLEVVEWEGGRALRSTTSSGRFRIPLAETLPERFTMEFDVILEGGALSDAFRVLTEEWTRNIRAYRGNYVTLTAREAGIEGAVTSTARPRDVPGRTVQLRIAVDGDYAMVYADEERVANVPVASFERNPFVDVRLQSQRAPAYLTGIRIAAGGTRLADALLADGRVATQGILFGTGSATLRPESTPTLKEIAEALRATPGLRLRIEGHTDSVGAAEANQRLSEQRAQAVVAHLTGREGIAANRLEAAGMGQAQPIADNATAEGRAQNRRVELVVL